MTLAIAVNSDYQSVTGKTLSIQAELLSKLKTAIVDVTYTSEDYDIAGNVLDLTLDGRLTTIIAVTVLEVSTGNIPQYVPAALGAAATGKLKLYESGTASAVLDEADDADSITMTCKLRVVGF
ncbi:MAG: hypothetical protein HOF02_07650 [Gammaproteobacteria bacterium]|jgi:hypothetical protein|nr:hypothetical protein [Gammaproteobacteria bacterium]